MSTWSTNPARLLMAAMFAGVGLYLIFHPGPPAEPKGWRRVHAGPFSIALPGDFQQNPLHSPAGEAGQWSSRRGIIGYDLDSASGAGSAARADAREELIGGRKVRILTRQDPGGLVEMEARVPVAGAKEMDLLLWGPEAGLEREFLSVVRSVRFEEH